MPESPRMPRPGAKDAPVFDVASEDPRSYFKHLESLLEECKIDSDAEKKRHTLRYLPEDVEDQWKYQDHYKAGTYANWKKEILRSYTGKSDEDRGTIHQLRRIMKRFSNISITDAYEYAKMKREAQPVMAQVMENKYATNREITDLIWEVLTRDFAMAIRTRISLRRVEPAGTPITSENRYPYAEVLKIGQHLIDEANDGDTSGRSGRTYSDTSGTSVKIELKESMNDMMKEFMAGLTDVIQTQTRSTHQQFDSVLKALHQSGTQVPNYHQSAQNSSLHVPSHAPSSQNRGWQHSNSTNKPTFTSLEDLLCYFCDQSGHMSRNCPHRLEMVEEGLLIERDGRTLLKDGGPIPRFPVEYSQKQRVEKFYEKLHKQEAERRSVNMMESFSMVGRGVIPVATMPQINRQADPRDIRIAELERLVKAANIQLDLRHADKCRKETMKRKMSLKSRVSGQFKDRGVGMASS
ncbi:hypothetical protein K435DRAFT_799288 [Dendrothele bispora CBS 962.96]|uniref:CCHC-type domain-containing protein n=1 Tax=Dendrothele bispora (strain CBS 962.96) TaxID=1314807 RepID=A0A4S8LWF5_DENBC|nr:hypothetical protein K435DRAFT_799288 [Dendrothele bispora CBS 962.96]